MTDGIGFQRRAHIRSNSNRSVTRRPAAHANRAEDWEIRFPVTLVEGIFERLVGATTCTVVINSPIALPSVKIDISGRWRDPLIIAIRIAYFPFCDPPVLRILPTC